MTTDFAEALRDLIEPLSFVDKLTGLVRAVVISEETEAGKKRKSFPVACNVSAADCTNTSNLKELCPDDSKKSVMYFEENGGSQLIGFEKGNFKYRAQLRLVGWLNLPKLGVTSCSWSAAAVLNIINVMPLDYFNITGKPYTRCKITGLNEVNKSAAIFSKYTYDEAVNQYLIYPLDYFALDITIEYVVPRNCIEALIPAEPINCPAV